MARLRETVIAELGLAQTPANELVALVEINQYLRGG